MIKGFYKVLKMIAGQPVMFLHLKDQYEICFRLRTSGTPRPWTGSSSPSCAATSWTSTKAAGVFLTQRVPQSKLQHLLLSKVLTIHFN